jgi:uncharacterized protein (DUF305 family)
MRRVSWRRDVGAVVAAVGLAASGAAAQDGGGRPALSPAAQAKADSGRPPFTAADVHFMQGMISHHAQAVVMAGWAPSHGARADVRRLCERIDVAQRDEIVSMQRWLQEHHETVPQPDFQTGQATMPAMAGMNMAAGGMGMMPGMLTPAQMKQLNEARGPDFDRLFLMFMIQHHQGALTMVEQLFGSEGAAQDDKIFKFASDVGADQTAEIDRMTIMLGLPPAPAAAGSGR